MNNRNGRASRGLPGSTPSWLSKGRYCVSRVSHFESIETSIWRRKSEGGEAIVRIGSSTGVSPNLLPTLRASGQAQPPVPKSRWASSARSKPSRGFRRVRLNRHHCDAQAPCAGVKLAPWCPAVGIVPRGAHRSGSPNVPWISFNRATHMYKPIATWFWQAGLNPWARMHSTSPKPSKA